jgi:hypothetical protein
MIAIDEVLYIMKLPQDKFANNDYKLKVSKIEPEAWGVVLYFNSLNGTTEENINTLKRLDSNLIPFASGYVAGIAEYDGRLSRRGIAKLMEKVQGINPNHFNILLNSGILNYTDGQISVFSDNSLEQEVQDLFNQFQVSGVKCRHSKAFYNAIDGTTPITLLGATKKGDINQMEEAMYTAMYK